jgi:hypothetical protein
VNKKDVNLNQFLMTVTGFEYFVDNGKQKTWVRKNFMEKTEWNDTKVFMAQEMNSLVIFWSINRILVCMDSWSDWKVKLAMIF